MTHPPTPLSKIPLPFRFDRPEDSPGFLLWQTTTLWQRHIKKVLDPVDLAHPQFVLMALLLWFEGNQLIPTQILLARLSKLDKMTVSKSLRKLAAQGYIKRAEHPQDTRAKSVALTEAGKKLVTQLFPQIEAVDAAFFGKLQEGSYQDFVQNLQTLSDESPR